MKVPSLKLSQQKPLDNSAVEKCHSAVERANSAVDKAQLCCRRNQLCCRKSPTLLSKSLPPPERANLKAANPEPLHLLRVELEVNHNTKSQHNYTNYR